MGLHLDPLDSGLPRFLPRLPRLHLHYPVMVTSLCTPAPTTEGTMSPSTLTPTICSVSIWTTSSSQCQLAAGIYSLILPTAETGRNSCRERRTGVSPVLAGCSVLPPPYRRLLANSILYYIDFSTCFLNIFD